MASTEHTELILDRTPEPKPNTFENHQVTKGLEREVELLQEMLAKSETNAEHWRKMAERQQVLLEDKRPKGFFKRLLGQ